MSDDFAQEPILTLEPLIDAVRAGVEEEGWELSGLQKTTSHQFEGRWEGDSTRSAYLFFHHPDGPEHLSVDVYLDETSRGLHGNLALVVDLLPLGEVGEVDALLGELGAVWARTLPDIYRRPITLRFRVADAADEVERAETEVRLKVRIPRGTIREGPRAVTSLASEAVKAFAGLVESMVLDGFTPGGEVVGEE